MGYSIELSPQYTPPAVAHQRLVAWDAKIVEDSAELVKVAFSAKRKWDNKVYTRYTGYPGLRTQTAADRLEKKPEMVIREAVRRMLPKNKLGRKMLQKLKIFTGTDHPHHAQQPEAIDLPAKK